MAETTSDKGQRGISGSGNGLDNKCLRAKRDWWFREWPRQQVTEGREGLVVLRMAKTTIV